MKTSLLVAAALALGSLANAQGTKAKDDPACANIVKACEGAGFAPGDHKKGGKGLWADCVHKLAKGETVAGVTATQDEAKACQTAAKADHKANKAARDAKKN